MSAASTVLVTSRSFAQSNAAPERRLLESGLRVVRAGPEHDLAELESILPNAVAWIAGVGPIRPQHLHLAPHLQVIARYGVGTDGIQLSADQAHRIVVTNTPGANSESVADLTVALMIGGLRHVSAGNAAVRRGDWSPRQGRELSSLTIGLVGFGRIGQAVARRLNGFGSTVLAHDPAVNGKNVGDVELVGLDRLKDVCDVVSIHVPGGVRVIDTEWFARRQPVEVLVNTSRADVVDERAIAEAVRSGQLKAYAADTVDNEFGSTSPLLAADLADRIVVTPHLGAQTRESALRMGQMAVDGVLGVLQGSGPVHQVELGASR